MNFREYLKIETDRLVLRQINVQDIEVIYKLRSNSIVCKFISRPLYQDRAEAKAQIEKLLQQISENASITWIIMYNNKSVGTICLWNFSNDRKTAEVGYDLLPKYHNKGIMTEALQPVLKFGFNVLQLNTIEAYTHSDNINSRRLLERQGFIFWPEKKDEGFPLNVIYSIKKPL
ncbi:GNAT family N-acetyltransferase [uncultured Lacinutrix sp.]|uniref:GNAT family N-acetyltransferase n=1 Tax=uncultured Lacinutrix sp. TaxID=574032 RepID=UPI00261BADAC|nr:GNAT family N-acetyltransferase [uncultured Lacinutrix sp.]